MLLSFVSAGLDGREKCIVAVADYSPDFLLDRLRGMGVDLESVLGNQLTVLTPAHLFADSVQPMESAVSTVNRVMESTLEEEWDAVRVCTGFNFLLRQPDQFGSYLTRDNEMNRAIMDRPVAVVCTFDAERLHKDTLNTLLDVHPYITDGATVTGNKSYRHDDTEKQFAEKVNRLVKTGALSPQFAQVDFCGDLPVIRVGDEMDMCTAPEVEEAADTLVNVGHRRLILDLSKTSFMDAASVGAIVRILRSLKGRYGALVIYDPSSLPRRIFQLIEFDKYVPIKHDMSEAVSAVLDA